MPCLSCFETRFGMAARAARGAGGGRGADRVKGSDPLL